MGDRGGWGRALLGRNRVGQLVLGDYTLDKARVGDNETPASLGADGVVALGGNATSLSAGDFHTSALLEDGTVRCWGYNTDGQLGLGNIAGSRSGTRR